MTDLNADQQNAAGHRKDIVKIEIDGIKYDIHRGRQSVESIKQTGKVDPLYLLEQMIDGELTSLEDDGYVVIKGDEVFISSPRDGGSS